LIYYTVYNADGKKIADCGSEYDAKYLANVRNGTYKTNRLGWKETFDIEPIKYELPSITIAGTKIPIQQELPNTQQKPLNL